MSAPRTDIETQSKRHRGPIIGIVGGVIFVALLALAAFVWPGIPLEEQAAPDGVPTETTDDEAVSGGPSIIIDNEANTAVEETQ
jgi:hypothetical protein